MAQHVPRNNINRSRSRSRSRNRSRNDNSNSSINISDEIQPARIGLFVINAHSNDTEKYERIGPGFRVLHYCPPDCKLRSIHEVKGVTEEISRLTSVEHACMRNLKVYDTFTRGEAPNYLFYTMGEPRHGLFFCNGEHLVKIETLEKGKRYTLSKIIRHIRAYMEKRKLEFDSIDLGIMACRSTCKDATSVYAIPVGASKRPNHPPFSIHHNINWRNTRKLSRSRPQNRSRSRSRNRGAESRS